MLKHDTNIHISKALGPMLVHSTGYQRNQISNPMFFFSKEIMAKNRSHLKSISTAKLCVAKQHHDSLLFPIKTKITQV